MGPLLPPLPSQGGKTPPPRVELTLEEEEGLSMLAGDGRVFSRPYVRAQRRLNPQAPPWEPLVALARAGEGDKGAGGAEGDEGGLDLELAAERGPTMTPSGPIPITARPPLARGLTGVLLRRFTRDTAGSISESAGATSARGRRLTQHTYTAGGTRQQHTYLPIISRF